MEETYICEYCKKEYNIQNKIPHTINCQKIFLNNRDNKSEIKKKENLFLNTINEIKLNKNINTQKNKEQENKNVKIFLKTQTRNTLNKKEKSPPNNKNNISINNYKKQFEPIESKNKIALKNNNIKNNNDNNLRIFSCNIKNKFLHQKLQKLDKIENMAIRKDKNDLKFNLSCSNCNLVKKENVIQEQSSKIEEYEEAIINKRNIKQDEELKKKELELKSKNEEIISLKEESKMKDEKIKKL